MAADILTSNWFYLVILLVGACFGSAVSALSYRLPRAMPVGCNRSRCTQCDTVLRVRDLFPILSWVIAKGKCRHCSAPVHWRYPVIELICAAGVLGLYQLYGFHWEWLLLSLLWVCTLTLIVTDFEHYMIPDEIQLAMAVIAVAYGLVVNVSIEAMVGGAFSGFAIGCALHYGYFYFRGKHGLGFGDVKFLAVVGLLLGAKPLVPFLFLSGIVGIITALIWRAAGKGAIFPFGPALAISMWLLLLFPMLHQMFWALGKLVH